MPNQLPPWLRDDDDDPSAPPNANLKPTDAPSSAKSAPPPAKPASASGAAPWLTNIDFDDPNTQSEMAKGGKLSNEFLARGDSLVESVETELTYDEWMARQTEQRREKDIEEEVPEFLQTDDFDPAPAQKPPGTAQLPDWFLGLEKLEDDEPEWMKTADRFTAAQTPPAQPAAPDQKPGWMDADDSFAGSLPKFSGFDDDDEVEADAADPIESFFASLNMPDDGSTLSATTEPQMSDDDLPPDLFLANFDMDDFGASPSDDDLPIEADVKRANALLDDMPDLSNESLDALFADLIERSTDTNELVNAAETEPLPDAPNAINEPDMRWFEDDENGASFDGDAAITFSGDDDDDAPEPRTFNTGMLSDLDNFFGSVAEQRQSAAQNAEDEIEDPDLDWFLNAAAPPMTGPLTPPEAQPTPIEDEPELSEADAAVSLDWLNEISSIVTRVTKGDAPEVYPTSQADFYGTAADADADPFTASRGADSTDTVLSSSDEGTISDPDLLQPTSFDFGISEEDAAAYAQMYDEQEAAIEAERAAQAAAQPQYSTPLETYTPSVEQSDTLRLSQELLDQVRAARAETNTPPADILEEEKSDTLPIDDVLQQINTARAESQPAVNNELAFSSEPAFTSESDFSSEDFAAEFDWSDQASPSATDQEAALEGLDWLNSVDTVAFSDAPAQTQGESLDESLGEFTFSNPPPDAPPRKSLLTGMLSLPPEPEPAPAPDIPDFFGADAVPFTQNTPNNEPFDAAFDFDDLNFTDSNASPAYSDSTVTFDQNNPAQPESTGAFLFDSADSAMESAWASETSFTDFATTPQSDPSPFDNALPSDDDFFSRLQRDPGANRLDNPVPQADDEVDLFRLTDEMPEYRAGDGDATDLQSDEDEPLEVESASLDFLMSGEDNSVSEGVGMATPAYGTPTPMFTRQPVGDPVEPEPEIKLPDTDQLPNLSGFADTYDADEAPDFDELPDFVDVTDTQIATNETFSTESASFDDNFEAAYTDDPQSAVSASSRNVEDDFFGALGIGAAREDEQLSFEALQSAAEEDDANFFASLQPDSATGAGDTTPAWASPEQRDSAPRGVDTDFYGSLNLEPMDFDALAYEPAPPDEVVVDAPDFAAFLSNDSNGTTIVDTGEMDFDTLFTKDSTDELESVAQREPETPDFDLMSDAAAPAFTDIDSYLASLSSEDAPQISASTAALLNQTDVDIDRLFSDGLSAMDGKRDPSSEGSGLEQTVTPDWLNEVQASVGEVSPTALVRQRKDRDETELPDSLKKLREREQKIDRDAERDAARERKSAGQDKRGRRKRTTEEQSAAVADPLDTVLPGSIQALAPAPVRTTNLTLEQSIALSPAQQGKVELLRSLVKTGSETATGQTNRLSALDMTYDTPYLPDMDENENTVVQPAKTDEIAAAPNRRRARRRTRRVRVDRLLIALVLVLVVLSPFFVRELRIGAPPPVSFADSPRAAAAFAALDGLQVNDYALIALEYSPTSAGELDAMTDAVLRHALLNGARPVVISTNPFGVLRAENLIGRINADADFLRRISAPGNELLPNLDYYVIRYLSGGAIGLREFSENPAGALSFDSRGGFSGIQARQLNDFRTITLITDSPDDVRVYAEQFASMTDVPLTLAAGYAAAPVAEAYNDSANFGGLLIGYADALAYQTALVDVAPFVRGARQPTPTPTLEPSPQPTDIAPALEDTPSVAPGSGDATDAAVTSADDPAPTPTDSASLTARVSADSAVNVRGGDGTGFPVIGQVQPGANVTVIGFNESSSWVNVRLEDGRDGWISAALLALDPPNGESSVKSRLKPPTQDDDFPTPVPITARPTRTGTRTVVVTATRTATRTRTATSTSTETDPSSDTPRPTSTGTPEPTNTLRPTATDTREPTNTTRPTSTATATVDEAQDFNETVQAMNTTLTAVASQTGVSAAAETSEPTNTRRPTFTREPTDSPTATDSPPPTIEDSPTAVPTAEATPDSTVVPFSLELPTLPTFTFNSDLSEQDYQDGRWYAFNLGIIAAVGIIGLGAAINIVRGLLRRRGRN